MIFTIVVIFYVELQRLLCVSLLLCHLAVVLFVLVSSSLQKVVLAHKAILCLVLYYRDLTPPPPEVHAPGIISAK